MQSNRHFRVTILFLACFLALSCGNSNPVRNSQNTAQVQQKPAETPQSDENEELGAVIAMPFEPEDVVWRKNDAAKSLIAVLRFPAAETKKLKDSLAAAGRGVEHTISPEDWFPAELLAQSESNPDASIVGTAYPATEFYQPPYTEGTITAVKGTDFFILELRAR